MNEFPMYGYQQQPVMARQYPPMPNYYPPAQVQQPQQSVQTNMTWIPVNGLQGAKDHIVQPNQRMWFMDNNEPRFYVKSADNMGTTTMDIYEFKKISESDCMQPTKEIEYITREEFENRLSALKPQKKTIKEETTE